MKIKLLKKARRNVILLNRQDIPANTRDKCIKVVITDPIKGPTSCTTSKNSEYYTKYGNAWNKRCETILKLAAEIKAMSWWKKILY